MSALTDMDLFRARNCAHWLADAVCGALATENSADRRAHQGYVAVAQNRLEDIADALGLQVVEPTEARIPVLDPITANDDAEPTVTLADAVNVWKGYATCALMRGDEGIERAEAEFRTVFPRHYALMFGRALTAPAPALAAE